MMRWNLAVKICLLMVLVGIFLECEKIREEISRRGAEIVTTMKYQMNQSAALQIGQRGR